MTKSAFQILAVVLGGIGVVLCLLGISQVWTASGRFAQLNDRLFETVERSLNGLEERGEHVQDRIAELTITTQDIEQRVKNWSKSEVREQIESRTNINQNANRVVNGLSHADHFLELSESSLGVVKQSLDVVDAFGIPLQVDLIEEVEEEVAESRDRIAELSETIENTVEALAGEDSESKSTKLDQAVSLAAHAVATFTSVDEQIDSLNNRLFELQEYTVEVHSRVTSWIRFAELGIILLLCWMALGQGALCYLGWSHLRQQKSASP